MRPRRDRTWLQPLRGPWQLAPDPRDEGRAAGWFAAGPVEGAEDAPVPGIIQQVLPGYHGVAWYWHRFVPAVAPGPRQRALLRFGAVDYLADVWLNGRHVGGHEGGETPFLLEATDALRPAGENRLVVRVLNPTEEPTDGIVLAETPHRNKFVDDFRPGRWLNFGGVLGAVDLLVVPAVRIADVFAQPDASTGRLRLAVTVRNDDAATLPGRLLASAGPAAGAGEVQAAGALAIEVTPGETRHEVTLTVPQWHLWSPDDPYLYRVAAAVEVGEPDGAGRGPGHEHVVRCGFRDFRVVGGYFRLNGRRLFLRSVLTGNHCPIGQHVAPDRDDLRRDLLYAKAAGFNTVRFAVAMATPEQLDLCDELGLLAMEENYAGSVHDRRWQVFDTPQMAARYDGCTREMILRDRNHPSIVMWQLLNETHASPLFRHGVAALSLVRGLDPTRVVLLNSGRFDRDAGIGSVCNPGGTEWEHVWGAEAPGAPPLAEGPRSPSPPGAGEFHAYPQVPHSPENKELLRTLGRGTKPVFLAEYGVGSLPDVVHAARMYEQARARPDLEDAAYFRSMAETLAAEWRRYGMEGAYPFPEDMLLDSQRRHARWRLMGLNLIRANPHLCGYNMTGSSDQTYTGQAAWTFWREWKAEVVDALSDGWAPLRWCLFVEPAHGYVGRPFVVEAVLATEDVLPPGEYPARFRLSGPTGVVWERQATVRLPRPPPGTDMPLAVPVLREEVVVEAPPGVYRLTADLERGGSPAGRQVQLRLADPSDLPAVRQPATLWGIDGRVEAWLEGRGLRCRSFVVGAPPSPDPEVLLVGDVSGVPAGEAEAHWTDLAQRIGRGGVAVFLSPLAFRRGEDPVGWLPLATKGRCSRFVNHLFHREDVARRHPIFAGLQADGILDWDYYDQVIAQDLFDGQDTPDDVAAAAFAVGYWMPGGCVSGLLVGSYRLGAGRFVLNSMRILEHVDVHPAADRLLLNLIAYAGQGLADSPAALPADFAAHLAAVGYAPGSRGRGAGPT
jgi:hypothetical protein